MGSNEDKANIEVGEMLLSACTSSLAKLLNDEITFVLEESRIYAALGERVSRLCWRLQRTPL